VVVACPAPSVVADGVVSGVQSAPAVLKSTGSPLTGVPLLATTVAVMVDVALPLAVMLAGLAAAVTVWAGFGAGLDVWSITVGLDEVKPALAVIVQKPEVPLAW
jgi:hypothetical protein